MGERLGQLLYQRRGRFVTTAMEDTGTLQSLTFRKAGRIDYSRVMVLRTVSNFDQQRPGVLGR